jgi:hypothetical protein
MKFFVPGVEDHEAAEGMYQAIRKVLATSMGKDVKLSDRRVCSVSCNHGGRRIELKVGQLVPYDGGKEMVHAIFFEAEKRMYMICTPNRGFVRGKPYLVAQENPENGSDFEP